MLTIKHYEDGGRETLQTVESVSYDAAKSELTGHGATGKAAEETGGVVVYSTGHAFVMNENGKTVGAYNMRKQ